MKLLLEGCWSGEEETKVLGKGVGVVRKGQKWWGRMLGWWGKGVREVGEGSWSGGGER